MNKPATIAIAGFQHETNTFAPHLARFEDFLKTDGWPGLTRGKDVFTTMAGLNIPISGFIQSSKLLNHRLRPILWASAEPSSYVAEEAFETISKIICDSLSDWDDLDAVYLDLHGAMVTEYFEDGEGELLGRIRNIIGPDIPLVISLDLHANITEAMMRHVSAMTIFRTYPHLDMAETGARACQLLESILNGKKLVGVMRKIPFLFPLTSQCTDFEPCKSIYQQVEQVGLSSNHLLYADFATGFPPADINECGAAVVVYGDDQQAVSHELDHLFQKILDIEPHFTNRLLSADEAIQRAMASISEKPVVIADAQDNPGAGGTSDTTGILNALVENQARLAVLGVIFDPEVAKLAHQAGQGKVIQTSVGGKSGYMGSPPYTAEFIVEYLADGNFVFTGEMYRDSKAQLGQMALLRVVDDHSEVRFIISSERVQCLDLAIFRHLGIQPERQKILVVKSSVHFRADFDPIARQTLVVASPGAHPCQLANLKYKNLRKGVRLEPLSATE